MVSNKKSNFEELAIIGKGAYGTVFKAKDIENDRMVALKRVRIINSSEEKGVPVSTLREITLLKQLDNVSHPNIVRVFDAFQTFSTTPTDSPTDLVLTIVFEHVDQDLSSFLHNCPPQGLSEQLIKDLMFQLLSGVDYLHMNRMVHRDIKPQNVLITKNKQVKIADFGLARVYGFCKLVTTVVVTLWYRAPEVLLQCPYATAVDLWSVGTIMVEMYNRRPIFPGKSEVDQLHKILSVIGSPGKSDWPKNVSIPYETFSDYPSIDLKDLIVNISDEGIHLLKTLLVFDPAKRSNASKCLLHEFFRDLRHNDANNEFTFSQDSGIGDSQDMFLVAGQNPQTENMSLNERLREETVVFKDGSLEKFPEEKVAIDFDACASIEDSLRSKKSTTRNQLKRSRPALPNVHCVSELSGSFESKKNRKQTNSVTSEENVEIKSPIIFSSCDDSESQHLKKRRASAKT